MAYRSPADDLAYGESWDRDRFAHEKRERDRFDDRDRFYEPRSRPSRAPVRDPSMDGRFERRAASRPARPWEDEPPPPRRERVYWDDEPRPQRVSPPSAEFERRVVIEDRERDRYREPSPSRRPHFLRRQSSLDTFDRGPRIHEREQYGAPVPVALPVRRQEYRPEPYEPIPLPRSRALPPPRVYAERDLDEIKISEPDYYGNEEFYAYPERIREREIVKPRRRRKERDHSETRTSTSKAPTEHSSHRSRSTRSSSHTRTKRSASSSSSSSESGATTTTVKSSEYPKKGKTRIPDRLVSKRAIIDLGYPFIEEGSTIVIQKALGQQNIDDLLKLSEDYKKAEAEVAAARSSAGQIEKEEVFTIPPPPPAAPAPPATVTEKVVEKVVIRDPSPARTHKSSRTAHTAHTSHTSHTSRSHSTSTRTPTVVNVSPPPPPPPVEPTLALTSHRSNHDIEREIALLEAERDAIRRDPYYGHHPVAPLPHHLQQYHHHEHSYTHNSNGELVRAERLPTGELVLYEEQIERIEEPRRGPRIEKDKKGRMSISVPKYAK